MDRSTAVGEYLRARRALISPESVGFVADQNRKVSGLRREEVAVLAGISPEYYLRLEQGRDHQPSDQVLHALAKALQLDEHGIAYLERLVHPPVAQRAEIADARTRARLRALLAQWRDVPAVIFDSNLDVVATNHVADELGQSALRPGANRLVWMFDEHKAESDPDVWEQQARQLVGAFRMRGEPDDPRYQEIVGQLSVRSADFRRIWGRHDVHVFVEGECRLRLPPFGEVQLAWRNFAVAGLHGHVLSTFFAPEGSAAATVMAYFAARAAETQRRSPSPSRLHASS